MIASKSFKSIIINNYILKLYKPENNRSNFDFYTSTFLKESLL